MSPFIGRYLNLGYANYNTWQMTIHSCGHAICLAQLIIFNHRSHFQLIIRHTCNLQILIFLLMKNNKFELFNNILTPCSRF